MSDFAYIGRAKCCKNVVAACLDDPRHAKDVANFVRDCIKDGLTVERIERTAFQFKSCKCKQEKAKAIKTPLFDH